MILLHIFIRTTSALLLLGAFFLAGCRSRTALIGWSPVVDGDTLEIAGERVRPEGIDAPESGQPYGRVATDVLR